LEIGRIEQLDADAVRTPQRVLTLQRRRGVRTGREVQARPSRKAARVGEADGERLDGADGFQSEVIGARSRALAEVLGELQERRVRFTEQ
jgi:hypothetical protein